MIHTLNPLSDSRWDRFVNQHAASTIFHTSQWLQATQRAYGFNPIVYTTAAPGEPLRNGVVFCEIRSWLTGRRLVSLPFADHCSPLLSDSGDDTGLFADVASLAKTGHWKYIELRPAVPIPAHGSASAETFALHTLDLSPPLDAIFHRTHKTSIRQPVSRAEREGITYQCGSSRDLLEAFYGLLLQTRRRHGVPPQPLSWFEQLINSLGPALQIHLARKDSLPVASIVTLRHKQTLVYKYGCSDIRFNHLGATPYLLWKAITQAKNDGLVRMDFGRSDLSNKGLIDFKERWGCERAALQYRRWLKKPASESSAALLPFAKRIFSAMPYPVLNFAGRILYRHVG